MPPPMWPMYIITSRYFQFKRGNGNPKKKKKKSNSYYTRNYFDFHIFFLKEKRKLALIWWGLWLGLGYWHFGHWALRKVNFNARASQCEAKWACLSHLVTLCTEAQMPTRYQNHRRHTFPTCFTSRPRYDDSVRVDICWPGVLRLALYAT